MYVFYFVLFCYYCIFFALVFNFWNIIIVGIFRGLYFSFCALFFLLFTHLSACICAPIHPLAHFSPIFYRFVNKIWRGKFITQLLWGCVCVCLRYNIRYDCTVNDIRKNVAWREFIFLCWSFDSGPYEECSRHSLHSILEPSLYVWMCVRALFVFFVVNED